MRHEAAWLRDYLVAGVEDPRINLQSVLTRHFLTRTVARDQFERLMEQECRFAAVMNWLLKLAGQAAGAEDLRVVLRALERGADNAEGTQVPAFVGQTFAQLRAGDKEWGGRNYIEEFLGGARWIEGHVQPYGPSLSVFRDLWQAALSPLTARLSRPTVLEPACGSANDYRFLEAYGLARLVDYSGFDLCAKNIDNARALFPGVQFEVGNAFAIDAPDAGFDVCFVHDLFEHLSLAGLETAVREVCRVTSQSLCVHFFNLDDIPEHIVRPVDEYHWNTLSLGRMLELFAAHGFSGQVVHVGTFLRRQVGCTETHNPNAWTFVLRG